MTTIRIEGRRGEKGEGEDMIIIRRRGGGGEGGEKRNTASLSPSSPLTPTPLEPTPTTTPTTTQPYIRVRTCNRLCLLCILGAESKYAIYGKYIIYHSYSAENIVDHILSVHPHCLCKKDLLPPSPAPLLYSSDSDNGSRNSSNIIINNESIGAAIHAHRMFKIGVMPLFHTLMYFLMISVRHHKARPSKLVKVLTSALVHYYLLGLGEGRGREGKGRRKRGKEKGRRVR
ncbi:MAG: hypothetical protein QXI43_00100 [Candidatus Nitrosocaldus sp.]